MKENSSQMLLTTEYLMLKVEKIKKHRMFLYGRDTEERIRDGRSSMLTKLDQPKRRELVKTSVSMSTDHSISDLDFQ
jgi:hypothetical protein